MGSGQGDADTRTAGGELAVERDVAEATRDEPPAHNLQQQELADVIRRAGIYGPRDYLGIVQEQIRVAAGMKLSFTQDELAARGHATGAGSAN